MPGVRSADPGNLSRVKIDWSPVESHVAVNCVAFLDSVVLLAMAAWEGEFDG